MNMEILAIGKRSAVDRVILFDRCFSAVPHRHGALLKIGRHSGKTTRVIKRGKTGRQITRLSCHRFRSNEVRLWLSVIAYNLGNLWRRLALPLRVGNWSLTSLQQRLVKRGGRVVKHARYYWLLLAEGHLTRCLFVAMMRRIEALTLPAG